MMTMIYNSLSATRIGEADAIYRSTMMHPMWEWWLGTMCHSTIIYPLRGWWDGMMAMIYNSLSATRMGESLNDMVPWYCVRYTDDGSG